MNGWRVSMEDRHSICPTIDGHKGMSLFSVYDGHGGKEASDWLALHWPSKISKCKHPMSDTYELTAASYEIDQEFKNNHDIRVANDCGSTLCTVLIKKDSNNNNGQQLFDLTVVNIGDSCCILYNKYTGKVDQRTQDHKPTLPGEIQRIQNGGFKVTSGRVDGNLALSRAIGDWKFKSVPKLNERQQPVVSTPDITRWKWDPQTQNIMIMCDGLTEKMTVEEITSFMLLNKSSTFGVSGLLTQSLQKGSKDNMTAIHIQMTNTDDKNFDLDAHKLDVVRTSLQFDERDRRHTAQSVKTALSNFLKRYPDGNTLTEMISNHSESRQKHNGENKSIYESMDDRKDDRELPEIDLR